ncbi:MAG: response regulator [Acidimicrobiales bacterium]
MGSLTGIDGPAVGPRVEQAADNALAGLWDRFRETFDGQVSVLEAATREVLSGRLSPESQDRALREAHKLAGSLGTFGMPRGSEIAREIEGQLRSGLGADAAAILELSDRVVGLRRCLEAGPARGPEVDPGPVDTGRFLLVVDEDDSGDIAGLSRQASARGLDLVVVNGPDAARQLLGNRRPEAVLMDLGGSDPEQTFALMRELQARQPSVPVVVLTRAHTFTDRVEAASLGGQGFLEKPIPPAEIVAAVDDVLTRAHAAKATVLAVDDDPIVLAAVSLLLKADGRLVVTLDQPSQFWRTLRETSPDLVVLDVDMPEVSGVEMCQVMRADPQWSRLPVVFLTARTDGATVQDIFAAGADDYVVKPLVGPELRTRIANRLERSGLLRRMAETDILTGVANQRASAELLERLLGTAARFGQPVALGVIDVDRMRSVNDRFGYGAGDDVLARLGQLLARRFHGDDTVGRWAGQEFFVGMVGMSQADGVQRLADVLEEFRALQFSDGQGASFGVSFSAGVAQYPLDGKDLRALYRGADSAVHRAKEVGGDRVVPVGWSTGGDATTDVVVVEDDDALAGLLLHGLSTRAYRSQRFDDGQEAAIALEGPAPKVSARVVLLDWGMPSLDGLGVLRRLSETGVLHSTRVIMLTARDSESEVLMALDLGAFDHVAKPFSVPVLMKRVHRAMQW